METIYIFTPFCAWFTTGVVKFIINTLKDQKLAFNRIGFGGMPSNHSAIITSAITQVGIQDGTSSPAFGIGLAVAFIIVLDATSLRRQVGLHAKALNNFEQNSKLKLRERIGHKPAEILAGILVGGFVAYSLNLLILQ